MLPPGAIFELKIHQKCVCGQLGELTALPRPLACFQRAALRQGKEGGKRRGGEGISPPTSFYNLTSRNRVTMTNRGAG